MSILVVHMHRDESDTSPLIGWKISLRASVVPKVWNRKFRNVGVTLIGADLREKGENKQDSAPM